MASALKRKWVTPDLNTRALAVTQKGRREIQQHVGIHHINTSEGAEPEA
jgi:hypothetical protein